MSVLRQISEHSQSSGVSFDDTLYSTSSQAKREETL